MPLGKVRSTVGWIFKRVRVIPLEKMVVSSRGTQLAASKVE